MKKNSLYIAAAALLMGCGSSEKPAEPLAAIAAKGFYDHLVKGNYEEYLKGLADADSLPPHYRSQLIDAAAQLVASQTAEHRGIDSVAIVGQRTDSLTAQTVALLTLCFKDSLREEVAVPMVESGGKWMMR